MKKKIWIVVVAIIICSQPGFSQNLNLKLDIKETKLDNGLRILTLEDHSIPNLTYYSFFKVGSRN